MSNSNDDVIECVQIRGVTIDLADVSDGLRRKYQAASAAAGRNATARAKLNEVGAAILAEQMPHLAIIGEYARARISLLYPHIP